MDRKDKSHSRVPGVPYESDEALENTLWGELQVLPQEEPSEGLRRAFYRKLEQTPAPFIQRARSWFGFNNNTGWVTAAACILLGLTIGRAVEQSVIVDDDRIASLEQRVSTLNRSLVLDRLESDVPSKRLQGVLNAVEFVEQDAQIATALLTRATEDNVSGVRSAAIDALGPLVTDPAIGFELMRALRSTDSPLVQLSLVDLVLRFGSVEQVEELLDLMEQGALHQDLTRHVQESVRRNPV
ncbi:MAG: hypothetical protein AAF438_05130 [Pseudomonadota bacterium]